MSEDMRIVVGGSAEEDGAAFVHAWESAERGEQVEPSRVLAFETWEAMVSVLTGERFRLLRHLHAHPEPSVSALARSMGRHLRRVQVDVRALEDVGLVSRARGRVEAAVDQLRAEANL